MGTAVLESVRSCLAEAGFSVGTAYPGQECPRITQAVAAYHIRKVEAGCTTIEVLVLCPASMGGLACEEAALEATEALQTAGAVCVQGGCSYDSLAQTYCVSILASFFDAQEEPGFGIQLNGVSQPWAVAFSAEKIRKQTVEYAVRSPEAVNITSGCVHWQIHLEELIPYGSTETAEPGDDFSLKVTRSSQSELYSPCRWSSVTRSFTAEGLRRIRKGIALQRKEVST